MSSHMRRRIHALMSYVKLPSRILWRSAQVCEMRRRIHAKYAKFGREHILLQENTFYVYIHIVHAPVCEIPLTTLREE